MNRQAPPGRLSFGLGRPEGIFLSLGEVPSIKGGIIRRFFPVRRPLLKIKIYMLDNLDCTKYNLIKLKEHKYIINKY